ncbi:MAG: GAF and ANTAR domain-containing protein [Actinomycetota bacterium]|nr:GAF and ANTAR domain-containing protein [Actinomycetota bacterium]
MMRVLTSERVAAIFVEFADTLVEEFDVIEFMQMVATRASELVAQSDAGILLGDKNNLLQFMAASDERTELLELFQVQAHEGPCQDCYVLGAPVINTDLRTATERWPRFAPRAVAAGFRSVHAFPLRLRQEVIGALNLFSTDVGVLEPSDVRLVQALADVATIGLLQERAIRRGEVLSEQLQGALNSRIIIEQAKGVLAQIHGCTVDEGFNLLRAYCRTHNLLLSTVAAAVVHEPKLFPALTAP